MGRLRGLFEARWFGGGRRRRAVGLVVVAVGVGGLGFTGCVADPPPLIGTAIAGDGQAVVSWQAPLAAPAPVTAYVVTPWIGSVRQTPVVFTSTATTQTVTGLTNGVAYAFTVHAVNAHGDDSTESGMSNQVIPGPVGNVLPNPGFEQGGCGSTPVICEWATYSVMSQDTTNPHSGTASMSLDCGSFGCYPGGFGAGAAVSARTEPVYCVAIGAGDHPASFWYVTGPDETASLSAAFFQTPDCTGAATGAIFTAAASGGDWQQAIGDLTAPAGTQSAFFYIMAGTNYPCDDYCYPTASFDDLAVA